MYELLLSIHLLAAATWVGGAIAINIIAARLDGPERGIAADHFAWYGQRVIMLSAIVLLLAGFGLVAELEHVEIGDLWIILALVGYAVTFVMGAAILGPTGEKLGAAAQRGDMGEADRLYRRIISIGRIDVLIIVLVLLDMAVKPGT